jgi:hypothetical protein
MRVFSILVMYIGVFSAGAFTGIQLSKIDMRKEQPSNDDRDEAEACVADAFNCLGEKQHRVFSDLRKALERDPRGTVNYIITHGQSLDMDGEYPMPKIKRYSEEELPAPKLIFPKKTGK